VAGEIVCDGRKNDRLRGGDLVSDFIFSCYLFGDSYSHFELLGVSSYGFGGLGI
jgi:hypothetical protein